MKNFKSIILMILATASVPATLQAQEVEDGDSTAAVKVSMAFGQEKDARDILGGVSYIDTKEVYANNFHTYALDNISSYATGITGWNGNIRGCQSSPIYVIDGVIRDINNVTPSEIEQITVLKSAEAIMLYGSIAANGAILVKTKRGNVEGLEITANIASGMDVVRQYPEYLGAAEYMAMYNQVAAADGLTTKRYSDEQIYYTSVGSNPYRYPDVDFYSSDYLKKAINRTDANLELNGGNEKAHFYSNIGYIHSGDFVKIGEGDNAGTSRLNVRGNVDINLTKNITAYVNANATFDNAKEARADYWKAAATLRPNFLDYSAPLLPISMINPDNKAAIDMVNTSLGVIDGNYILGASNQTITNEIANMYAAGSRKTTKRQFMFDAGVKANLSSLLDGLYFKSGYSMDFVTQYVTAFENQYYSYVPTWGNINGYDEIVALERKGTEKKSGEQTINNSSNNRVVSGNVILGYDKSFGDNNVSAMALANVYQLTKAETYHRTTNANLGFSANYNFAHKYYLGLTAAIPHTTKLAEGKRNGFSKSISAGWNIANEDFMQGNGIVSTLSLNANFGTIDEDIDIENWYMYLGNWENNYGGFSWRDQANPLKGTTCRAGSNYNLDFVKHKMMSIDLKAGFLDDMIVLEGSYFTDKREGLLAKPLSSYPEFMSNGSTSFIPYQNLNDEETKGYELGITFNKKFGDLSLSAGAYGLYSEVKRTKYDEVAEYDYQKKEGKPVNGYWGYQCLGIFQSKEEIENYKSEDGTVITQNLGTDVKPGDLIYVDQNGDNVIDDKDKVYLGKWGSPYIMGFNVTVKYKNFTLFVAGNANAGGYGLKDNGYYQIDAENGKYSAIARDCWTEETAATATYPRITRDSKNNYVTSDFWMYKTDAFNLERVQLTYDLPASLFENNFISRASVFVNASSLLRISKEKDVTLLNYYKENTSTATLQTRRFMFGLRVTF
ncbi:MAG: SusC/RagA family TonB-linked outer membrane protein [Bacteroidales bacterium]|nr:SusC/RagA family TonB-linked outer membrane protein [Bacteroidales bacterium]